MISPLPATATVSVQEVPAQSCGKGYTYTKLDSVRWKCLTDNEADKVATKNQSDDYRVSTIVSCALIIIVLIFCILLTLI